MNRPEISIVVPCLDEQENVVPLESAIKAELAKAGVQSFEILFIDNGSTDGTIESVKGLCAADASVKLIVNNRNYGQKRSPAHGIYQASGAAVIGMCADFQDPPGMIPEFIARWRGGAKIVLAQRISEKMSLGMRIFRFLGYGFLRRFNDYPVLPNVTGFGLYDREVVDCLKRWRDPEPFFRGMLVESGFSLRTAGGKFQEQLFRHRRLWAVGCRQRVEPAPAHTPLSGDICPRRRRRDAGGRVGDGSGRPWLLGAVSVGARRGRFRRDPAVSGPHR
jgi:glycosyltransferase involved in cell wall biosynthesis